MVLVAAGLAAAGLAAAALALTGCSKSSSSPTTPGTGANVTIEIVANAGTNSFSPNPASAQAGQTVAWHNVDSTIHAIVADDGSFDTGEIAPDATSNPIAMHSTGAFPYHCSIHPTMTGTLVVGK